MQLSGNMLRSRALPSSPRTLISISAVLLFGYPPKVIWVRVGNAPTDVIEALLRRRAGDVVAFASDHESAFLILD